MMLNQVYNDVLLTHNTYPQNKYGLPNPSIKSKGVNPSCGDEIELSLGIKEGVINSAAFEGSGCAISQASTDIMIDLIVGKTLKEAEELCQVFIGMIQGNVKEEQLEVLGEALALKDIAHMPARVKCAELGWYTLDKVLKEKMTEH